MDEHYLPTEWNDETRIACAFAFKCPKVWERLQPTPDDGVRHCPACDRDVHLARTEEDFRRCAEEGRCVAVRVFTPAPVDEAQPSYWMGTPAASSPYRGLLRKV